MIHIYPCYEQQRKKETRNTNVNSERMHDAVEMYYQNVQKQFVRT